MCSGERLNLQSDMKFFASQITFFSGNYIRQAVIFKSGSRNEVEVVGER